MAGKRIETYQGITTIHECKLYSDDFRKLFDLPKRKGEIVTVSLRGQTIEVQFSVTRHKYSNHQLIGGK